MLSSIYSKEILAGYDTDYFGVIVNMVNNPKIYKTKTDVPLIGFYRFEGAEEGYSRKVERGIETPEQIESLLVDYDSGDVTIADVFSQFSEYNIAIYSSTSDKNGTKFRLVIELDKTIHRDIYTHPENKAALKKLFVGCDTSTFDWNRYFHVPALVETTENYSHIVHMGGKKLSYADIGLTTDIGDYSYGMPKKFDEFVKVNFRYSMKHRTEGNATRQTALKDAITYIEEAAPFLEERGAGRDVHPKLLSAATTLTKAGLNANEGVRLLQSVIDTYDYSDSVVASISKEFSDMF